MGPSISEEHSLLLISEGVNPDNEDKLDWLWCGSSGRLERLQVVNGVAIDSS